MIGPGEKPGPVYETQMAVACKKCGGTDLDRHSRCRPCFAAYMRDWVARKKERVNAERRARHKQSPHVKRERDNAYRAENRERINAGRRGDRGKKHNERAAERKRAWYLANKARIAAEAKARRAERRVTDPDAFRRVVAERARRRRAEDARAKINDRMSALVRHSLKKTAGGKRRISWQNLVGYALDDLVPHLKRTIPAGYTWDDYLAGGLHLDHKIPVAAHNFTSPNDIDFKRCWALKNLQLLPKQENYEKRDKLSAPFQPALALAVPGGSAI